MIYNARKDTLVCINPKEFAFKKEIVLSVCGVGIPAAIQNILNVTGMTIFNNFAASFGADALAAMGIAQKIQMVPMQIALGASQGVMPLVSYNYASQNLERMKQSVLYVLRKMLIFLFLVVTLCFIGSASLIRLFMNNSNIVDYGSQFLKVFILVLPFISIDYLTVGVFQAIGAGKNALLFAFLRKIVLEIPALIVLNHLFPLYGLPYASLLAEFILSMIALKMLHSILYKRQVV